MTLIFSVTFITHHSWKAQIRSCYQIRHNSILTPPYPTETPSYAKAPSRPSRSYYNQTLSLQVIIRTLKRRVATKSSTLPLSENTPPRASVGKYQASPCALLSDLDDRLPSRTVSVVGTAHVLRLSRQADDLARRCLYG